MADGPHDSETKPERLSTPPHTDPEGGDMETRASIPPPAFDVDIVSRCERIMASAATLRLLSEIMTSTAQEVSENCYSVVPSISYSESKYLRFGKDSAIWKVYNHSEDGKEIVSFRAAATEIDKTSGFATLREAIQGFSDALTGTSGMRQRRPLADVIFRTAGDLIDYPRRHPRIKKEEGEEDLKEPMTDLQWFQNRYCCDDPDTLNEMICEREGCVRVFEKEGE